MYNYSFETLEVWKNSRKLAKDIYSLTGDFPDSEKFGMVSQLRRAAVSICSNIAEGSSRTSAKDQKHFYQIAYSSTTEIMCQLLLSFDLEWINQEELYEYRRKINEITNKLNALSQKQI